MIPIPRCRVVLAPQAGRLHDVLPAQTEVAAGDVVAHVETSRGRLALSAPAAGRIGGALVGASHRVGAGEGVVWLDVA